MTSSEALLNTGFAALEEEDGKFVARGMALGAGDVTNGGSGKETLWPKDTLKEAASELEGKPLANETNHTAQATEAHTPASAIVGEVTDSFYGEVDGQEGILFEAEVDDPDIARNIENGRIEVSPLLFRDVEEHDGPEADYVAKSIDGFRDLATVRNGASPSASIEPGKASAMSAEALHSAVGDAKGVNLEKAQKLQDDMEMLGHAAPESLKEDIAELTNTDSYEQAVTKLERL